MFLRRISLHTLLPSIVLAVSPLAGCADHENEATPEPDTPAPVTATATAMNKLVACRPMNEARYVDLTPASGIDGIAFFNAAPANADGGSPPTALGTIGTPCGGASDHEACLVQIANTIGTPGWNIEDYRTARYEGRGTVYTDYGVLTRGDTVTAIHAQEELRQAVAPIDGLKEARTYAAVSGVRFTCGEPNARVDEDGVTFQYLAREACGGVHETLRKVRWDGTITQTLAQSLESSQADCIEGRRPSGLTRRIAPWLDSLRGHFDEIAHMEAAAVLAFSSLEEQLAYLDAPSQLLARVDRARRDEIDHAERVTTLARRHGGKPARPALDGSAHVRPSVLEMALENEMEGCVRETYGALIATYQARHAADPAVREMFARIAADETEHAELSRDIGAWLGSKLSDAERALVRQAREQAWEELATACAVDPAEEVMRDAGMPSAHTARALLTALRTAA